MPWAVTGLRCDWVYSYALLLLYRLAHKAPVSPPKDGVGIAEGVAGKLKVDCVALGKTYHLLR